MKFKRVLSMIVSIAIGLSIFSGVKVKAYTSTTITKSYGLHDTIPPIIIENGVSYAKSSSEVVKTGKTYTNDHYRYNAFSATTQTFLSKDLDLNTPIDAPNGYKNYVWNKTELNYIDVGDTVTTEATIYSQDVKDKYIYDGGDHYYEPQVTYYNAEGTKFSVSSEMHTGPWAFQGNGYSEPPDIVVPNPTNPSLTATRQSYGYIYMEEGSLVHYGPAPTNPPIGTVYYSEGYTDKHNAKIIYEVYDHQFSVTWDEEAVKVTYSSIPPTTASVVANYVDKNTGLAIAEPSIYAMESEGNHTYNAINISGYAVVGDSSQTINVVAGNNYNLTFYYDKSTLPTCTLFAPSTAIVGDDVNLSAFGKTEDTNATSLQTTIQLDSSPYIIGTNPIVGDTKTFNTGSGGSASSSGSVFFNAPGTYTARAYAVDSNGNVGEATPKEIVVTNPTPSVVINQTGTLKENRKVIIDASSSYSGSQRATIDWTTAKWTITPLGGASMDDIRIQTHTIGSVNGTVLYDPSQSINKSLDGLETFDMQFKKAGQYQVQCTLSNNYSMSNFGAKSFTIVADQPPIVSINTPSKAYRDPEDNDYVNIPIEAVASSTEGDCIDDIVFFAAFNSKNSTASDRWLNETYYILDNSTLQWQAVGNQSEAKALDITKYPTCTTTTATYRTNHVGKYDFQCVVKEHPGQEYIPQFFSSSDIKIGSTW